MADVNDDEIKPLIKEYPELTAIKNELAEISKSREELTAMLGADFDTLIRNSELRQERQEGVLEGEARGEIRGETRGEIKGAIKGEAKGIVETLSALGFTKEVIRQRLMEKLFVNESAADQYMQLFWNASNTEKS